MVCNNDSSVLMTGWTNITRHNIEDFLFSNTLLPWQIYFPGQNALRFRRQHFNSLYRTVKRRPKTNPSIMLQSIKQINLVQIYCHNDRWPWNKLFHKTLKVCSCGTGNLMNVREEESESQVTFIWNGSFGDIRPISKGYWSAQKESC